MFEAKILLIYKIKLRKIKENRPILLTAVMGGDRHHLLDTNRLQGHADLYPFQQKVKLNYTFS